jgi:alpha-beta hydrolase superfamily lysophospholipase
MSITISKMHLNYQEADKQRQVEGFLFLPENFECQSLGLFTHGYTSHKVSILSWCNRLAESGMACALFDLPGHYLGTFNEIDSFEAFKEIAPQLFVKAAKKLSEAILVKQPQQEMNDWTLVLGGHSLGALLALKASTLPELNNYFNQHLMCVGFGLPPRGMTHVFESPFYKATLEIREQLVSPALKPSVILPWIKEQKEQLKLENKSIFLLTGDDDVVVGKEGTELLAKRTR